ncbi:MAG TPA: hypothetical protein VK976_04915 [Verrucomicrobiae bacterium]|nr:hypothetical protein [Verrucomicrobiae bacterium]
MNKGIVQGAGRPREIVDIKNVALYAPETGNILHMHSVIAFKGGQILSEQEAIEEAHRDAKRTGLNVSKLKTVLSTNPEHALRPHRVDLRTGELVRHTSHVR